VDRLQCLTNTTTAFAAAAAAMETDIATGTTDLITLMDRSQPAPAIVLELAGQRKLRDSGQTSGKFNDTASRFQQISCQLFLTHT